MEICLIILHIIKMHFYNQSFKTSITNILKYHHLLCIQHPYCGFKDTKHCAVLAVHTYKQNIHAIPVDSCYWYYTLGVGKKIVYSRES